MVYLVIQNKKRCSNCNGTEFVEGSDFMHIRPVGKKLAIGSNKIFTFCLECGEVISIRIENPKKFSEE
jgi:hypothetical protein